MVFAVGRRSEIRVFFSVSGAEPDEEGGWDVRCYMTFRARVNSTGFRNLSSARKRCRDYRLATAVQDAYALVMIPGFAIRRRLMARTDVRGYG